VPSPSKTLNLSHTGKLLAEDLPKWKIDAMINDSVNFPTDLQAISMAKKSMIEREKKRHRTVAKYAQKREALKEQMATAESQGERMDLHRQLQQLPRNSARVRVRNRCWVTGRSRGYFRDFGLSRNVLREMAHEGLLPGVVKSSW
jgi:small subunit ribosomal protein S14